ncbi:hypothetical protein MUY27_13250 [Mucilaginibacter sp. RS28]|uniref:Tetratricopeptide repeat protein n=1 Tax=Mucilaginibacter straminoryzae TaxID=2932774 RepID=A0A9X2BC98_9SPHI|nr:hypothetical protein [Mucilaginibacter straminoryzae]MCJ8210677.1 hypothetical protein [Mucilaginibacter straminoryzae]
MEQQEKDRQAEALWNVLVNPADKRLHLYDLQNLVGYYPQSNLLYLLIARSGSQEFIKSAAVYYNSQSLYKLVQKPEYRPPVDPLQVIDLDKYDFPLPPPMDPLLAHQLLNYEPSVDDLAQAELNRVKFGSETSWTLYNPDEPEIEESTGITEESVSADHTEEPESEVVITDKAPYAAPVEFKEENPPVEAVEIPVEPATAELKEEAAPEQSDNAPDEEMRRLREERRRFFQSFDHGYDSDDDHQLDPFHLSATPPVESQSYEPELSSAAQWQSLTFDEPQLDILRPEAEKPQAQEKPEEQESISNENAASPEPAPVIPATSIGEEIDDEVFSEIEEVPDPAFLTGPVPEKAEEKEIYTHNWDEVFEEIDEAPQFLKPFAHHQAEKPAIVADEQPLPYIEEPVKAIEPIVEVPAPPMEETVKVQQQVVEEVKDPQEVISPEAKASSEQRPSVGFKFFTRSNTKIEKEQEIDEEVFDEIVGIDDIIPAAPSVVPPVIAAAAAVEAFTTNEQAQEEAPILPDANAAISNHEPEPLIVDVEEEPVIEEITEVPVVEEVPYVEPEIAEEIGYQEDEAPSAKTEPVAEFDGLIAENIVSADYFLFKESLVKEPAPQPAAAPEAAYTENPDEQTVTRYHDESLPYTFLWWLDKTRREHARTHQPFAKPPYRQQPLADTPPAAPSAPEPEPKKKEEDIIERFIKEEPQIKPPSSDKLDNENKARNSAEDSDVLVTETLARIYTEQMLYHKAIATYKKLMLRFPEKSRYFASQIQFLENKIK